MADLDLERYEKEVLQPLRERLPRLTDDLLTQYAVRLDMSEDEIRARVKTVVAHWNKLAMKSASSNLGLVCGQLQRRHDARKAEKDAFNTLAWWSARARERDAAVAAGVVRLASRLKTGYAELGMITAARLRLETTTLNDLGEAAWDQAREAAGLRLVDPLELPTAPGTRGPYRSFENTLIAAGAESVVHLVHPGTKSFGITVTPSRTDPPLSGKAVDDRAREIEKLPDSPTVRARNTAVRFLRTELGAGTDLASLALFHLLVAVRKRRDDGVGPAPLFDMLTSSGLRAPDAAHIALSVVAEDVVERDPVEMVTCPACRSTVPKVDHCEACSYPIPQHDQFASLIDDIDTALSRADVTHAEGLLDGAARLWAVPDGHASPLATRLAGGRGRLEREREREAAARDQQAQEWARREREREREQLRQDREREQQARERGRELERQEHERTRTRQVAGEVSQLMSDRKYRASLALLRSVTGHLPQRDQLVAKAEAQVELADARWRASRAGRITDAHRARLLREALDYCADHQAREELSRIPPEPPAELVVDVDERATTITLSWSPSAEPNLAYVVMRSPAADPSRGGGDRWGRLATVPGDQWQDRRPLIGIPLRYAVFSNRSGMLSSSGAEATKTVFLTREPEVRGIPGDGRVDVSWTLPAGACDVEISRTQDGVGGTGRRLRPDEPGRLTDRDVANGTRHRYTLRAVYEDMAAPGGRRRSRGRDIELTPHPTPELPGPVRVVGARPPADLTFYPYEVDLRWPVPEHGRVRILRFDDVPPTVRPGDRIAEAELHRHGQHVFDRDPPLNDPWTRSRPRFCHYVPALVTHGTAYIGHGRAIAAIDELGGLSVVRDGTTVRLSWTWPDEAEAAVIAYDATSAPEDLVGATHSVTVAREPDARGGETTLDVGHADEVHLLMAACVTRHDTRFLTSGARRSVPPATAAIRLVAPAELPPDPAPPAVRPRPMPRRRWALGNRPPGKR